MLSNETLETVFTVAGCLHFTQIPAMLVTPRILDWNRDFSGLSPINRQIVKVVLGGIVLCVVGLGAVVVISSSELARSRFGGALSGFLSIFWSYRAIVQLFVYSKTWPRRALWSHACLSCLFPALAALYGLAFVASALP